MTGLSRIIHVFTHRFGNVRDVASLRVAPRRTERATPRGADGVSLLSNFFGPSPKIFVLFSFCLTSQANFCLSSFSLFYVIRFRLIRFRFRLRECFTIERVDEAASPHRRFRARPRSFVFRSVRTTESGDPASDGSLAIATVFPSSFHVSGRDRLPWTMGDEI